MPLKHTDNSYIFYKPTSNIWLELPMVLLYFGPVNIYISVIKSILSETDYWYIQIHMHAGDLVGSHSTHISRGINTDIWNPNWVVNIASAHKAPNIRVVNSSVQCLGSCALTSANTWWFINAFNFSSTCSNKPNVKGSSYSINLGRVIKISVLSQLHLLHHVQINRIYVLWF